jgi:acetolactate synthase-1/3 small subunit
MLQIFTVHVEDLPGVLNRVASLFRRRAFNITSLTVGPTDREGVSRMTIVVDTDEGGAERLTANLYKLVSVLRVENITRVPAVCRDLAMIKVAAPPERRTELIHLVHVFRARIVDVAPESLVIEITGTEDKVDSLLEVLRPYGVLEMARTGRVAMARGSRLPGANAGAPPPEAHAASPPEDAGSIYSV